MTQSELIIGVDGGGTKTVAWLAPLDDATNTIVLGRGHAGPGNPRAVGFERAQANIDAAIAGAFADAKLPRRLAVAACFGLAGAGRPSEQQQIAKWAERSGIASRVRVTGDAEPILAAASPENVGITLISGTGSLAFGRDCAGNTARSGGWGYLLGDEGSGYSIALTGLQAAVRAADGRASPTDLLSAFQQALGVDSPQDLVSKIYDPEMSRDRIARLASILFELRRTDQTAERIIAAAATDLAQMVASIAAKLAFSNKGYTLALAGGVLLHQLNYVEEVVGALMKLSPTIPVPGIWIAIEHPVGGAVALARQAQSDPGSVQST